MGVTQLEMLGPAEPGMEPAGEGSEGSLSLAAWALQPVTPRTTSKQFHLGLWGLPKLQPEACPLWRECYLRSPIHQYVIWL